MERRSCWIFLSHSSKDMEKVRFIRNEFEKQGHNPLAFGLRCLNDDTPDAEEELWNLIYREIDMREWFVYCESQNSRNSNNVAKERAYIRKSGSKKVWTIDLNEDKETIAGYIRDICEDITVYISYSHYDSEICNRLYDRLSEKDFNVLSDRDIKIGKKFDEEIVGFIEESSRHGAFVSIVTSHYADSEVMRYELECALKNKSCVIPVIIGDFELPDWMDSYINRDRTIWVNENPTGEELQRIADKIEESLRLKLQR